MLKSVSISLLTFSGILGLFLFPIYTQALTAVLTGTDSNGVKSYDVTSVYNAKGTHVLRVLEPTSPAAGVEHTFLYALPVKAELSVEFGDGLEVLRVLGAHNTYNATIIAPSFDIDSWYADHATDPDYRYESFMTLDLQPWVEANLATSGSEQHWLLGFSKSGNGPIALLFKHPSLFTLGAFWDFPANMSDYTEYGANTNYGTQANFDNNYRLTSTFLETYKTPFLLDNRLWISGFDVYQTDVADFDALLTSKSIEHTLAPQTFNTHRWDSGWVASAVLGLYNNSIAAPVITSVSAGSPSTNSATITWTTDVGSSSKIDYGTLPATYNSSTSETDVATGVTSHSVTLSSLAPCTTYFYRVRSKNFILNETVDTENTFTTAASADCTVWSQTNWAGGSGQTTWSDITKFSSSVDIDNSISNLLMMASSTEKFSNKGFESDLSSWTFSSTSSPISFWNLDEASGTRVDAVGDNDLTDVNTVTQATGKVGNAGQFTAANSEYLSRTSNSTLQAGDIDFTISAWVYFDSKNNYRIFVSKDGAAGNKEYDLYYDHNVDRLDFGVYRPSDTLTTVLANSFGAVPLGQWIFVVGWHDAAADTINIQVNNGAVNSASTGGPLQAAGTADFRIGELGGQYYMDGRIDAVGFWKEVLSAAERTTLYNSGNGSEYPFDAFTRNTATTFNDSAGSAKLVADAAINLTQSVNVGNTSTYSLSAYAYTTGAAVTSSDVELYYNGSTVTTTYAAVGDGWYKLTGNVVGANALRDYGVQIKTGKTVYLDNLGLNRYPSSATLTSSILDTAQQSNWGTLTYLSNTPANTSVAVKVRSSDSADMSDATAFASCSALTFGLTVGGTSCAADNKRYVQYQIDLANTDSVNTPLFTSFSLKYTEQEAAAASSGSSRSGDFRYPSSILSLLQSKANPMTLVKFSKPVAAFTKNLQPGFRDGQIRTLQKFLNQNGFKVADKDSGSLGNETDYFGELTYNALTKFQNSYKERFPALAEEQGYVGPVTREIINSASPEIPSSVFESNLALGSRSDHVSRLQKLLATQPEIYPEGLVTGYFGPLTKKAIQMFQLKYGVVSSESDAGFGVVGPKTREKMKEVF